MSVHPLTATVLAQPVGAYDLTSGRLWSVIAAVIGLAGVVVGGLALARSTAPRRRGAVVALVAGAACMVIGALVVAAAKGGPGTGYGIVGGFVDLAVGLVALVLGGVAAARTRRTT
ncbi:DUF6223 family protein [Nonomuraea sp. NPDC050547]|uniref:DUF6223 family protein n=1 Tax=unclassified Nonomuraea TaxID=2593643 RepID=UPI00378B365B